MCIRDRVTILPATDLLYREEERPEAIKVIETLKDKTLSYIASQDDDQFSQLVTLAQEKGDIPEGRKRVSSFSWLTDTTASFNFGHVFGVDGTDAISLTKGNIKGRQLAKVYTDFLRKYVPGFENAQLISTGDQVGIRESRRIVADYMMSVEDFKKRRSFEDEIARNCYFIDVHLPNKESTMVMEYLPEGESHGISYRSLLPQGMEKDVYKRQELLSELKKMV